MGWEVRSKERKEVREKDEEGERRGEMESRRGKEEGLRGEESGKIRDRVEEEGEKEGSWWKCVEEEKEEGEE
ncbi:hypothetical protein RF55_17600, partial [Lasius niger]